MAFDIATFKLEFPELSGVGDVTIQYYLDKATNFLDVISWGSCYDEAVLNYAAHYLALSLARQATAAVINDFVVINSTAGILTEAEADSLSVSYQPFEAAIGGDLSTAFFSQTGYGLTYLNLSRSCLPRGVVAGSKGC